MSRSSPARCWRSIFLACSPCLLPACASDPLGRPEVIELAENRPTLPRSVSIQVNPILNGVERYGDRDSWVQELKQVFHHLKVCSAVWDGAADPTRQADMTVEILLENGTPAEPEIDTQAATLDFFAWSAVPLLSWWIRDVSMDPGIKGQVVRTILLPSGQGAESLEEAGFAAPAILTNLRERYPLKAWPTLGGIFLPPFAFSSRDLDHFCGVASARVRREVAIRAARAVKEARSKKELLSDLAVEGSLLKCRADLALGGLRCRLEGSELEPQEQVIPFDRREADEWIEIDLSRWLSVSGDGDSLLRIEAYGQDGRALPYSVRLPATLTSVLPWDEG
ncbi:MAG: hypothetical protein HY717_02220 [Planctomycetes bacterium]|nr:hypothetical protein [Planctomycetota bacterium]